MEPTMNLRRCVIVCSIAIMIPAGPALAQFPAIELSVGIHLVHAEVANTFETRAQGLMFRRSLGPNGGMLFVFPQADAHCMWMKNTLIPLSVAFIDGKGRVVSISEMLPQTETSHCAKAPANYALEMNRGWFASKRIRPGATIEGVDKAPPPR
jgi:uncharacterized membrane protein (UPF0127 family)